MILRGSASGPMADLSILTATPAQPPVRPASWPRRIAGRVGVVLSAVLHIAVLGLVLFARPAPHQAPPPDAMAVDLVPEPKMPDLPEPKLDLPKFDFQEQQAAQAAAEQARQQKAAEQQQAKSESPASEPPARQQKAPQPPASAQQAQPPRPSQPSPQSAAAQQTAQSDAKPAAAAPGTTDGETPGAAAARIAAMMHLGELDMESLGASPAASAAKLSSGEVAAFKAHLRRCWRPPAGVPSDAGVRAVIRLALTRDGRLAAKPTPLSVDGASHAFPLVKSALDALATCQPYTELPADKYREWKLLDLTVTPQGIGAASAMANFSNGKPQ